MTRRDGRIARRLFVASALLLLLLTGGHLSSVDETTMLRTTQALLHGHREIDATGTPEEGLLLVSTHRDGEEIGQYGLGSSILGIPGYLVGKVAATGASDGQTELLERFGVVATNCVLAGLGTALAFVLALRLGARRRPAVLLAVAYSLGTYALVIDRTWWSDVPSSVALTGALVAAITAVQRDATDPDSARRAALVAGALLGAGMWFRLSSLLFVPVVAIYVAAGPVDRSRAAITRRIGAVAVGAMPVMLALGVVNWWRFGSPLETGYAAATYHTRILHGAYGLLLGPSRGLIWYAPPAIAGLWAIFAGRRDKRPERMLVLGLVVASIALFGRYTDWYGGQSYGPRYLLSVVPAVVTIAATAADRRWWWRFVGGLAAVGFALNLTLGILVYFQAVYTTSFPEAAEYNGQKITDPGAVVAAGATIHNSLAMSPLVRAAAHLPESLGNTVRLADGNDAELDPGPFPEEDVRARQFYLDDVHMADVWWLRWRVSGGPVWMLALVPILAIALIRSGRALLRSSGLGVRERGGHHLDALVDGLAREVHDAGVG